MPIFQYKAVDAQGNMIVEAMEATDRGAVAERLDELGYLPIKISEKRISGFSLKDSGRLKIDEIIIFTKQLVTLLKAGVPLLSCLQALIEQTSSNRLKAIIEEVYTDIEEGASFSEALSRHPAAFSSIYVNSVRAGEAGGALDEVLGRLVQVLDHEKETRSKIKSALRYPIMVVIALGAAFLTLTMLVIPKFAAMFAEVGVQLPLPTRVLIGIGQILHNDWHMIFGGVGIVCFGFYRYIRTEKGRYQWDSLKLKIPIVGPLVLKASMARFSKMFETLNRSGLPILQTFEIVAKTVGNAAISKEIDKASQGVRRGEGVATPLMSSKLFPPMVIKMIAIGEQSGSLDEMLSNVASHYDLEVDYAIKNLTGMIEPILTVGLGAVALFFALSIFLPMWNLTGVIK